MRKPFRNPWVKKKKKHERTNDCNQSTKYEKMVHNVT